MSEVIVDTNVASFLYDGRPQLRDYESDLAGNSVSLSFQTIAELYLGARIAHWTRKRLASLDGFVRSLGQVPHTDKLEDAWIEVMARAQETGLTLKGADGWVAAAAIARRAPLLTHDRDLASLANVAVTNLRIVTHLPLKKRP